MEPDYDKVFFIFIFHLNFVGCYCNIKGGKIFYKIWLSVFVFF